MRYLVLFLFIFLPLSASIVESNCLDEINKHLKPNTLVLLNIDAAVVDSPIFLGSEPWYAFIKPHTKNNREYYSLMIDLMQRIPLVGVEDETAAIIAALQKKGVPVLALTGRGKDHLHQLPVPHYDLQTLKELKSIGVNFAHSSLPSQLQNLPEPYALQEGIFFAGDADKGAYLKAILELSHYTPDRVIFVSKLSHLTAVEASLKGLGVDFVGIHYTSARHVQDFDPLAALIQFASLMDGCSSPLSDLEAIALKSMYQDRSLSEYAKKLLHTWFSRF